MMDGEVFSELSSCRGPLRDHRNDGVQFGGVTNIPVEGQAARIELMRERWEQGLDIWTGEASKEE